MIISARVVSDNGDGENKSCVVVEVGGREVSRVAFVRRFGANPDTDFESQLDAEIAKAKVAAAKIKELHTEAGRLL